MSTSAPASPFSYWADFWTKAASAASAAPQGNPLASAWSNALSQAGAGPSGNPWSAAWSAPSSAPWSAPWTQMWLKALSPGAQAPSAMPPTLDPLATARALAELPVEIAQRLQRFGAARMQEQMQILSALAAQEAEASPLLRQAAFFQQSSLAWGTELLEIMELCQERLLATGRAPSEAPVRFPKVA